MLSLIRAPRAVPAKALLSGFHAECNQAEGYNTRRDQPRASLHEPDILRPVSLPSCALCRLLSLSILIFLESLTKLEPRASLVPSVLLIIPFTFLLFVILRYARGMELDDEGRRENQLTVFERQGGREGGGVEFEDLA